MARHLAAEDNLENPSFDVDVVVVGSGFGGSVAALRLAEKGYSVLVYEAGRRFEDDDFAKTSWDLRNYLWAPSLGCYGVQRIHQLPHAVILAGAGVGGGSLNYANTLYVPPTGFFTDKQWSHITDWKEELSPHYEVAKHMLGVVENPCFGPIEDMMLKTARSLGKEDTFRKTPVGVYFGENGITKKDPFFGGEGPDRTGCTECGNCMVGCRDGAKNTLMKNYLYFAEKKGVTITPMRTVTDVSPLSADRPDSGFMVTSQRTGAKRKSAKDVQTVRAQYVVMAAGTWGTQNLLHNLKSSGRLPKVSDHLGVLTRTNSEMLGGAATVKVPPGVDLTAGVAITSSFHVDEATHIENVRYGRGSNTMGLFSTLLIPGDAPEGRMRRFLREFSRKPVTLLRAAMPRRWSERTVIALVMQWLDNSITVKPVRSRNRWKLTSVQGHGEPNPTWIPQGHKAIRAMARELTTLGGAETIAGGTWNELADIPMTAHFLGGAVISDSPEHGVIDPYHRVFGYPNLFVVDGSAISANLGVNPALTITAQAERAFAMWPVKGQADQRPAAGMAYRKVSAPQANMPGGA